MVNYNKPLLKNVGLGRVAQLAKPIRIRDIVDLMKKHLKMNTFRLAIGNGKTLGRFLNQNSPKDFDLIFLSKV